jgi:hypothetical protein
MAEYGRSLANNGPSHFELLELPATDLGFLRPIEYQRIDVPSTNSNLPSLKPTVEGRYRADSVAKRRRALDFAPLLQDDSVDIEILYQI